MDFLLYFMYYLTLPFGYAGGGSPEIKDHWYDIFISCALYLLIFAILTIIGILIRKHRKKKKKELRERSKNKLFIEEYSKEDKPSKK